MIQKKITNIFSIALLFIAGLLAAYTVWALISCIDIISKAIASGQLSVARDGFDIANFYMNNCGRYLVFALLLAAAGFGSRKDQITPKMLRSSASLPKSNENDAELDAWFKEMDEDNKVETGEEEGED